MNKFNKRTIRDFNPDKKAGNSLVKKRLKKYIPISLMFFALEIIAIAITWTIAGLGQLQTLCIVLVILDALALVTYFVIFDNGAANKLRKENFQVNGKAIKEGHTYYYALKKSGLIRAIINSSYATTIMIIAVVSYLI